MVNNYYLNIRQMITIITLSFISIISIIIVHRSDPGGGLQLNYPKGQRKKCRRLSHKFKVKGLVDLKTAVLGYTHTYSALQFMWSCASSCGGAASHAA